MKIALVNPPWSFEGSIYFGCRDPHLPLEYGYTAALLGKAGHETRIFDGQLDGGTTSSIAADVAAWGPDFTVVTTAPSYLFWRCAPPELRVPQLLLRAVGEAGGTTIVVGPHASTTPKITLRKLGVDVVVMGECEEIVAKLVATPRARWGEVPSIAYVDGEEIRLQGGPHASDMEALPALRWGDATIRRHAHHHHRFEAKPDVPGGELETSRGCPYHCTFCAKDNFRDKYRKRPLATVLDELDAMIAQGVGYVYFIDEIFLPDRALLEALVPRDVKFGVQMRIDNWSKEMLDLLGRAGCVSIEAGVESITEEGRSLLAKKCKLSTAQLSELLIHAKKSVPFVQANLLEGKTDDPREVDAWRKNLIANGVWANEPVPLFPYPGSPDYTLRWGTPDDDAWERAHRHYLGQFDAFSDIQEATPKRLEDLELAPTGTR